MGLLVHCSPNSPSVNSKQPDIAGERKSETEEKRGGMYRSERYFGRFHRSIPLPAAVDGTKIDAHYKEGVLTVTCPKTEEAKPKPIEVKTD
jgi:HSP20 family protein